MHLIETATGLNRIAIVRPVIESDLKRITVKRYVFKWKQLVNECRIFKLTLVDDEDILGLIALVDHDNEERIEIKLLTTSIENRGAGKKYDRIAGCLIAYAAREAVAKFRRYPAVSLVPKTELKRHYINKYGMEDGGRQLFIEGNALYDIIEEYLL